MLTKTEKKFLSLIAADPGIAAVRLPRAKRGETIKSLELADLIMFGRRGQRSGGWYLTTAGEIARLEAVAADVGGIPEPQPSPTGPCPVCGQPMIIGDEDASERICDACVASGGGPTFMTSIEEVAAEAKADNAMEKWADIVGNHASSIDRNNEHRWETLAYGFFLALGFTPEQALRLANEVA